MPKLVIVESPTKAKTISKFLGREYKVLSSFGHVRDLPKSDLGVDIENNYEAKYVIPPTSRKHVKTLKDAAEGASEVLFATDEDREGEAISWHLADVLKIKTEKVRRIVFHEITEKAINHAIENPRDLNMNLVDAQQARRILDRLYGYEISPILWRKVAPKLSAGRVQSVATKLTVDRERERMLFKKADHWDILGRFKKNSDEFEARLVEINGKKIAIGKDFDPRTGELSEDARKKSMLLLDRAACETYAKNWKDTKWIVESLEEKPVISKPSAPFTTSTLQQEAARKLNLSSKDTMRAAQALYERGYITYMRTDSTTLSDQALNAAREEVVARFGKKFLPAEAIQYQTKVKNAQEAHEAIRPAGETFKHPDELSRDLNPTEHGLYDLIWKRTIASQMLPAKLRQTTAHVSNGEGVFSASGKLIDFPGYMKVYMEGTDDETGNGDEMILPPMKKGDAVACDKLEPQAHETKPPARYTEPTLIKVLEKNGIGRPSTFASIISTILARGYVRKEGGALVPTWKAFAVVQLLEQNFTHLVDTNFTAEMEDGLDLISLGEKEYVPFLNEFYLGGKVKGLKEMLAQDIDARKAATIPIGEKDGVPVNIRVGRYGPFIEYGDKTANVPENMAPDSLSVEEAIKMIGDQAKSDAPLGQDAETGKNVYLMSGKYGPYVQLGDRDPDNKKNKPKMKSLPPGVEMSGVDLKVALEILSLPKKIGVYAKTGEPITVDIGRFGPYIKSGDDFRSVPKGKNLFDVTEAEATELLNQEKRGRGRQSAKKVIKDLGDGLQILDGKYGAYVNDGKTNASLPKNTDPESITLDDAKALIEKKKKKK